MSRITRYQNSIFQYINTKSIFIEIIKEKEDIKELVLKNNRVVSIALITILNGLTKKKQNNRIKTHQGYYMASGIDMLSIVINLLDDRNYFNKQLNGHNVSKYIMTLTNKVIECLTEKLDLADDDIDSNTYNYVKNNIIEYTKQQIGNISCDYELTQVGHVKKTDITTYQFNNSSTLDKYKKLKIIAKEDLFNFIDLIYGSLCRCSFVIGWLLGLGDKESIVEIENIAKNFSIMMKMVHDIENLEQNIENAKEISTNYIINYGVSEGFLLFLDNKIELIRKCMRIKIFSNTLKEIVDYMEKKIDEGLNKVKIDMRSLYSSYESIS